jgi:hypothetical protein
VHAAAGSQEKLVVAAGDTSGTCWWKKLLVAERYGSLFQRYFGNPLLEASARSRQNLVSTSGGISGTLWWRPLLVPERNW